MTSVLGLPLEEAIRRMEAAGVHPEIVRTAGRRETAEGTERVVRVSENGRRLTVARFPDDLKKGKA